MQAATGSKSGWFRAGSPDKPHVPKAVSRSDDVAALVIVAAYSALQIALANAHVPWLDEAQAWLLATGLEAPLDLLILPNEGHPPLWHWLLRAISTVLEFDQARYLNTGIAIVNAWLLARLLRGETILLAMMLFSFSVVQFWGYHFRPYTLVFTCILAALLLDRDDRPVAASWALAIACALHFFSGLLFAFWLIWQWMKGTKITSLIAPALFAAAFGMLAVLSALGNQTAGPESVGLFASFMHNMSWPLILPLLRGPLAAIVVVAALVVGFRDRPALLATLLTLLVAFAFGCALVYGRSPWHASFMTMLCFVAAMVAGVTPVRRWMLILILLPQVVIGLVAVYQRLANPIWLQDDLYALVAEDAGAGFDPERDLVGWPDMAIPEWAARYDIRMINGNNGRIIDAVDWTTYEPGRIDATMLERPRPYWLICYVCERLVGPLQENGATLVQLGQKNGFDNGESKAFRVE